MDCQTINEAECGAVWQIIKGKEPKKYELAKLIEMLKTTSIDAEIRKSESNSFDENPLDLDGEIWKPHPGRGWRKYQISNLGRVKHNGEIVPQKDKDGQSTGWLLLDGVKFGSSVETSVYVYRMVAETWLIKDGNQEDTLGEWHVHHVSNNGYDNRPENLIWLRKTIHFDRVHTPARQN